MESPSPRYVVFFFISQVCGRDHPLASGVVCVVLLLLDRRRCPQRPRHTPGTPASARICHAMACVCFEFARTGGRLCHSRAPAGREPTRLLRRSDRPPSRRLASSSVTAQSPSGSASAIRYTELYSEYPSQNPASCPCLQASGLILADPADHAGDRHLVPCCST
jgi:hypothetical protein